MDPLSSYEKHSFSDSTSRFIEWNFFKKKFKYRSKMRYCYIIYGLLALGIWYIYPYWDLDCTFCQFECMVVFLILAGPCTWSQFFPNCPGKCQSPVNIDSACASRVMKNPNGGKIGLTWCGYDILPRYYTLHNDGRKVALLGDWICQSNSPNLTGGPLKNARYRFVGLHFRWGTSNDCGSEHTLDYKSYPLELQLVHVRREFPTVSAAIESRCSNSIVIVSYFFKITARDNKFLNPVIHNLPCIHDPGSKYRVPPFPLTWIAPSFDSGYYVYAGSLSEPPCSEVTIWILRFSPTLCISSKQLSQFRKLFSTQGPILQNSRPPQLLNGRRILLYENK